jgi:hypothetical protein
MVVLMVGCFTTLQNQEKSPLSSLGKRFQNRSANCDREDKSLCSCRDLNPDFPARTTLGVLRGWAPGTRWSVMWHAPRHTGHCHWHGIQSIPRTGRTRADKQTAAGQHDPSTHRRSQGPRRSCSCYSSQQTTLYKLNKLHSVIQNDDCD